MRRKEETMDFKRRRFKFLGDALTRGDYGVGIRGGHNTPDDPDAIFTFDPDFGDQLMGSIESCLASGEWIEE
jgi:hypothetical protein